MATPRRADFDADERAFAEAMGVSGVAGCPAPAVLRVLDAGVLPALEQEHAELHVRGCRVCQTLLADLRTLEAPDATSAEERRIRARVFGERKAKSLWTTHAGSPRVWQLTMAACSVLAIAAGLVWLSLERPKPSALVAINHPPPATSIPEAFRLDKPTVELPPVFTWRGEPDEPPRERAFRQAFELYRQDQFGEASVRFQAITAQFPGDAQAHFLLGICELYLHRYPAATADLRAAQQLLQDARKTGAVSSAPRQEQRVPSPVSGRASPPFALSGNPRKTGEVSPFALPGNPRKTGEVSPFALPGNPRKTGEVSPFALPGNPRKTGEVSPFALPTGDLARQAEWYLSVALINEGDRAGARQIVTQLCASAGVEQTRACEAAAELASK